MPCPMTLLPLPADSNWGPHDQQSVVLSTEPQQLLNNVNDKTGADSCGQITLRSMCTEVLLISKGSNACFCFYGPTS